MTFLLDDIHFEFYHIQISPLETTQFQDYELKITFKEFLFIQTQEKKILENSKYNPLSFQDLNTLVLF